MPALGIKGWRRPHERRHHGPRTPARWRLILCAALGHWPTGPIMAGRWARCELCGEIVAIGRHNGARS